MLTLSTFRVFKANKYKWEFINKGSAARSLVAIRSRRNRLFFVAFDFDEYKDCKLSWS